MDKEEKKIGVKRKSKPVETSVDSGDDEPIGALLKLKSKRNSKKSKLVADGGGNKVKRVEKKMAFEDDELEGGMDDTLAIFRKKLRGPKKDVGSAAASGKDLSTNVAEPSCHSLSESANDMDLDPNSEDTTVVEGLKLKAKMKNKLSKVNSEAMLIGKSASGDGFDCNKSALQSQKEDASESEGEALEDSLSAFFQKVQSGMNWKSRNSSKPKLGKDTQMSNDGSKPNSGAGSEALVVKSQKLVKKFVMAYDSSREAAGQGSTKSILIRRSNEHLPEVQLRNPAASTLEHSSSPLNDAPRKAISENSDFVSSVQSSPSSLKGCSGKIVGFEDGKSNSEAILDQPSSTNEPSEAKDLGLNNDLGSKDSGQLRLDSSPFARHRLQNEDHDVPATVLGKCCGETDLTRISSQEADDHISECISSPMSASENLKDEAAFRKHKDESEKVIQSENVSVPSRASPEGENRSDDEEVNGDRGSLADPETKEINLSVSQRAARIAKKHRHGDMAYEGDIDWEVLMQGQEFFVSNQVGDKTREKLNSSSAVVDAENGKAAAVAAGLKARAVGPLEKLKFREVLKRKGGLQEYLECRNHILSVWNKDVSRILPLADFGVPDSPVEGESPRASLTRYIFTFLDQCGYINFGVPSLKEEVENCIKHDFKLLKEEKLQENSGLPVGDPEDGDSVILGKEKTSDTCVRGKNDDTFDDDNLAGTPLTEPEPINPEVLESSAPCSIDPMPLKEAEDSESLCSIPSCKMENGNTDIAVNPVLIPPGEYGHTQYDSGQSKNIIVVGAGPAGLTAARHLQRQGFVVTVLEARSRIGGRVFTDRSSLSVPVDLGASIITGVEADVDTERRPDPSSLICAQLGLELTVLNSDCPLYDTVSGQKVPADLDEALEAEYNSLLDDMVLLVAEKGERAMKMSLEEGLEYELKRHRMAHTSVEAERFQLEDDISKSPQGSKTEGLSPLERRVMDWHFAHLEYGCAALLEEVSLPNWNQDDVYGGFGGAHCMIKGGYSAVVESLGEGIPIHLDHVVTDISYISKDCETNNKLPKKVKVHTSNGKEFTGDAVLVTVPLGCLKEETIKFSPPLPPWKYLSIKRLGFGVLNKVVLEFSEVFWDDSIDYFGATAEDRDQRGWCFMFWNVKKTVGAPVLIALVVGKAAIDGQNISSSDHVSHALIVLRKLFGEDKVSDPVGSVVTDWGRDPYSYGAYSYVAVGSSGEDYDILGRPVESCIFFAGEATCKEHPDTVGGAMMSGIREAVRISDILKTGIDYTAEVEAMEAARRHLDIERSEVNDIIRRLDAVEFSNVLYKKSLDGSQVSSWGSMIKDMFFTAKTTAGRLRLAKELLNLPVGFLKTFASTREGLSTLNSWILDSMGKDGTQLLRHCVRLLVLVSNDLLAVRLSGVGKTVKEKVCVHTSRDIRAIASQLVSVWVELFRKEKASKKGFKLIRQSGSLDSKSKSPLVFGKPPLRTHNVESKGISKVSNANEPASNSHDSIGGRNVMEEDNHVIPMSEEEKAAFAAAEAARAAAIAAAKAYAASGAMRNAPPPKILSFHKFAMREQNPNDETDSRKNWSGAAIGRQDCLSEIDSRNCRVRDWSVDFSATGVNPETSKISVDNLSQRSHHSNEIANQLNIREHSGESVAVDSSILTKAWVDSAGSIGMKDYNAIERWQCQAAAAGSSGFSHGTMHLTDEEDSNMSSRLPKRNESSASQVSINNKESKGNQQPRGAERIKQSVVDYVASLLMPLYKARKIDRDGYKSMMKKTATKVMESTTDAEKQMSVFEFLDFKRKNKIRAFVDMLIERHMARKIDAKSGSSEKQ